MESWAIPQHNTDGQARNMALLRAAATLCFVGFFCAGEITIPSASAFDQSVHLSLGDVAIDSGTLPAIIKVHLKRSKCDQLRKGVDVFIGRSDCPPCPVSETLRYVSLRGPAPGPFFLFSDGTPLTKAMFVSRVRHALAKCGVNPEEYAGHSFRIGAATAAAGRGLEDSTIRLLGRWNSDTFLRYVRAPREQLAAYSKDLLCPQAERPGPT